MKNKIRGVVDRIENSYAVILVEGEDQTSLTLPVSVLPPDTKEGSMIGLKIETLGNKTRSAQKEVLKLIQGLKKRRNTA